MSLAAERFEEATQGLDVLSYKNMFGWRCSFINGNMQAGFSKEELMMRLGEKDRETFLSFENTELFNPKGNRLMKEYVSVPVELLESDQFLSWFDKSLSYTASLPAKVPKSKAT